MLVKHAIRSAALSICAVALAVAAQRGTTAPPQQASFASRIQQLSEPEGQFDTDNLISNEQSYLDVIPALKAAGADGGAYIGVGPDQNFSYIAALRPAIAFIVDVRRDNVLLHLLFKALFAQARNRAEYLSLLTARPAPDGPGGIDAWRDAKLERIVAYIDETKAAAASLPRLHARVGETIGRFGVPLSAADRTTIERFHSRFIEAGLSLKFETRGRAPRDFYPTYRDLLLGTDQGGHQWNYLASEHDFQFVKSLEANDLVVPVVGDLSGPHAIAAIGALMAARGERLSAFYASNVENYLFRDGHFQRFAENLRRLPRDSHSVIIRSMFGMASSSSSVQPVDEMLAKLSSGRYPTYQDLVFPAR
ncbi:MAG: hypothetical protein DMF92_07560 [Acidobacteria bacterium]|nr:MAG: hypothetical protein DMF92_07560 [Acidobacteriota bacterium]